MEGKLNKNERFKKWRNVGQARFGIFEIQLSLSTV